MFQVGDSGKIGPFRVTVCDPKYPGLKKYGPPRQYRLSAFGSLRDIIPYLIEVSALDSFCENFHPWGKRTNIFPPPKHYYTLFDAFHGFH